MADDPLVIDDGGSTRIKLRLSGGGGGVMDSLFELNSGFPVAGRKGSQRLLTAGGSSGYGTMLIVSIRPNGQPRPNQTVLFTTFEVVSGSKKINGELVDNLSTGLKDLRITVHGPLNNEPIVESKQTDGQRRYVIANAPPIGQVFIDGSTVAAYTAGNSIYTSLHVS